MGLRTRALKLSLDIFENARQLNRMTNDADKAWKQYTWETSLSDVSKCSFLHSGWVRAAAGHAVLLARSCPSSTIIVGEDMASLSLTTTAAVKGGV